ncbi:hypothetical protein DL240_00365 [Lujinxingia litoralis]|uniref:Uncharacterized protein n=1 Tax=Lujinxingia litoralis TaxID=2211119 RepID=A0A328C9S6_9DELT|nr:hypothetical protein [Lujinxingia litoralis]RAL24698.1 hypothetical protein DL240_00365 [Lujinxingia litoralis]
MREQPEPRRFVPGSELYEQFTTRGKRLHFEGPDGALMKVRVRPHQVRVYEESMQPAGRVHLLEAGEVRAQRWDGHTVDSRRVSPEVSELKGHWRVERAGQDWAIFGETGELLGLLRPPAPAGSAKHAAEPGPEALDTPMYASLNVAVAPRNQGALSEVDRSAPRAVEAALSRSAEEAARASANGLAEGTEALAKEALLVDAEADAPSTQSLPQRGWTLHRDYRDEAPLRVVRDGARPSVETADGWVLRASPAAQTLSDPALLVLTLEAIEPLGRQALASWLRVNLLEDAPEP